MWNNKFRFAVSLQIKQFQFRLKTWRQGREIAQAYGEKRFFTRRVITVCAMAFIILAIGTPGIIHLSGHHPNVVSVLKTIRQGIPVNALLRWFDHAHHTIIGSHEISKKAAVKSPEPRNEAHAIVEEKQATSSRAFIPETIPAASAVPQALSPSIAAHPSLRDTAGQRIKTINERGVASFSMNYCILANKADRTLYLFVKSEGGESWKTIERFPVLVGRNDGQKISAGDQRTPEGIYFIVGRKETEELNAIYGPLAYMLNYPNEEDRKAGRTGQGIWIHGTREDTTREATRGCVVLNNNDLLTLSRYLQLGIGTPVVIVNANGLTAPEQAMNFRLLRALREHILFEYTARRAEFTGLLSQWKQAWESRDIENYSRFYAPDRFFGEGMHWDAWREKKQRTFQAYSTITIGLDKISVSEFSESTAVVLFMQRYESNVLHVQRPKKLSFFRSDGRWKIFKEETFSRQELLL